MSDLGTIFFSAFPFFFMERFPKNGNTISKIGFFFWI